MRKMRSCFRSPAMSVMFSPSAMPWSSGTDMRFSWAMSTTLASGSWSSGWAGVTRGDAAGRRELRWELRRRIGPRSPEATGACGEKQERRSARRRFRIAPPSRAGTAYREPNATPQLQNVT